MMFLSDVLLTGSSKIVGSETKLFASSTLTLEEAIGSGFSAPCVSSESSNFLTQIFR